MFLLELSCFFNDPMDHNKQTMVNHQTQPKQPQYITLMKPNVPLKLCSQITYKMYFTQFQLKKQDTKIIYIYTHTPISFLIPLNYIKLCILYIYLYDFCILFIDYLTARNTSKYFINEQEKCLQNSILFPDVCKLFSDRTGQQGDNSLKKSQVLANFLLE